MANKSETGSPIERLDVQDPDSGSYNAVVESPKGSQNKFKYETGKGYFKLDKVLPSGAVFPHDFGFIPQTLAEDGDPIDILILSDQPTFTGCVVPVRIIGVIEAEQVEKDSTTPIRNDRLVAVAEKSQEYASLQSLKDMDPKMVEELEHFFKSYDEIEGKIFTPIGRGGPNRAKKLIDEAVQNHKKNK